MGSRESTGVPIFGELSVEFAAAPPNSTLLSNICSATLAISWVLDGRDMADLNHSWTSVDSHEMRPVDLLDSHESTMSPL